MTSQPYQSQANGPNEPFGRPATDSDPDLVIVDHDDDLDDDDAHDYDDDVIVAEITQVGMREPAATASQDAGDVSPSGAVPQSDVPVATPETTPEPVSRGDISEQWHDIQAMFVDDPQGSVERAAQAADAAVSALVESLRQRHAALTPAGVPSNPGDTEKLRETLRAYRIFCQQLTDLDMQLPRADAMAG